jgi:hypothetical protein
VGAAFAALLLLGGGASAGLAAADRLVADGDPQLEVSSLYQGAVGLTIRTSAPTPMARVELRVPHGYGVSLPQREGSEAGFVLGAVTEALGEPSSSTLVSGSLVVADPAAYQASAASCAPGTHAAVWVLSTTLLGSTLELPMFVDLAPDTGAADPALVVRYCPVWPASPAFPRGLQLDASVILEGVVSAPVTNGVYTWSALVTPATPALAPDEPRTFELRAAVPLSQALSLKSRYDAKTRRAVVDGHVSAGGAPRTGADVALYAITPDDVTPVVEVRTDASGAFAATVKVPADTIRIGASVDVAVGPCVDASAAPAGCLTQTTTAPPQAITRLHIPRRTDAHRAIRTGDQALARRSTLVAGDVPSGWTSEGNDSTILDLCAAKRPDLSALTVTGESASATYAGEIGAVSSLVEVYRTTAQARTAFGAMATMALPRCLAKALSDDEVAVRGVAPLRFRSPGDATKAFRLTFDQDGDPVFVDVVFVRAGRVVLQFAFVSLVRQTATEQSTAAKAVARGAIG